MMGNLGFLFISGLTIGALGSFHCIGMCGPLALSLPINHLSSVNKSFSILLYNFGRALTYTVMGILFGLLGQSFVLFNFQQGLSIFAGCLIIAFLIINKFGNHQTSFITKYASEIKSKLGVYLTSDKTLFNYFNIGILNGLLPCGLVYIALASAIATGNILHGGLLMFAFGLGTIPIMALTMLFGKFISINLRTKINRMAPVMILCVGILLIVRGLNLGIPYISPSHDKNHISCCHK
jgi:sulfite exporter TauE/SafE